MLLYETGMTDQEYFSCLMEIKENQRYIMRVLLNLHNSDQAVVNNYIIKCQKNLAQRNLGSFEPIPLGQLHLSVSHPFSGTLLHQSNLKQDFRSKQQDVTLPYLDTNINDNFIWIEFENTQDLKSLREQINKTLSRYKIISDPHYEANFNPHMTIGREAADCPEESVTTDPGFSKLRFSNLVITAGRVDE